MKIITLSIVFSFFMQILQAQKKETFDIVSYSTLKGWQKSNTATTLSFSKEEGSKFCVITLCKSIDATADAQQNFDNTWQVMAQTNLDASAATMQPGSTDKGWETKIGSAPFEKEGLAGTAILISSSSNSKQVNILIITNTDAWQKEMETFLESIDLKAQPKPAVATSNTKPQTNGAVPELWMINKQKYNYTTKSWGVGVEWVAFYPNGDFYPHLPDGGFSGFYEQPKDDSWSKAIVNGKKIDVNSKYGEYHFEKINAEEMKYDYSSSLWYKCKSVDGLKLDGAYTPNASIYANFKTIDDLITPGRKEREDVIFFKKDGTFSIESPDFFSNITYGKVSSKGTGTYAISNFSLVFTYNDGRKIQVSFTGIKNTNPTSNPAGYMINGLLNYKLGK